MNSLNSLLFQLNASQELKELCEIIVWHLIITGTDAGWLGVFFFFLSGIKYITEPIWFVSPITDLLGCVRKVQSVLVFQLFHVVPQCRLIAHAKVPIKEGGGGDGVLIITVIIIKYKFTQLSFSQHWVCL